MNFCWRRTRRYVCSYVRRLFSIWIKLSVSVRGFSLLSAGNWPSFYRIAGPCWRSWTTPSTTCFWCGRKLASFPLALTGSMMISPRAKFAGTGFYGSRGRCSIKLRRIRAMQRSICNVRARCRTSSSRYIPPARIENQIVDDLRDRLNELKSGNNDGMLVETHIRYLENLKKRRMRIFVRWMTGPVRSRCGKPSTNYWKSGW